MPLVLLLSPAGDRYQLPATLPVEQQRLPLLAPGFFVRMRDSIQIVWSGSGIVDPRAQQLAAVDEIDGAPVVVVLVRKIAPLLVVRG